MDCSDCRFWVGPKPLAPEQEAAARRHGLTGEGVCRRFPRVEKTPAAHWCGEWKAHADAPDAEPPEEA